MRQELRCPKSSFPPGKGGPAFFRMRFVRCGLRRRFGEVGGQFFRRDLRRLPGWCRLYGGVGAACRAALLAQGGVPVGRQGMIGNRELLCCVCRLLCGGAGAACRTALLAQGAVPLGRQGRIWNCAIFRFYRLCGAQRRFARRQKPQFTPWRCVASLRLPPKATAYSVAVRGVASLAAKSHSLRRDGARHRFARRQKPQLTPWRCVVSLRSPPKATAYAVAVRGIASLAAKSHSLLRGGARCRFARR